MIKKLTSKSKIIILVVGFVVFAICMYIFGYGIMANKNQVVADAISQQNVELEILQREQKSFEQGKKDLAVLAKSQYPPDELFSSDTKVVKEIQQLEAAAQRYGLDLNIIVSGTVKDAKPVDATSSGLIAVPYTLSVSGPLENILLYMQLVEHMPFVTHAKNLTISMLAVSEDEEEAKATFTSEFYIKK